MSTELDRLKTWMAENDIDARELARQTRCTYEYVYRILSGIRPAPEKFKWAFYHKYGEKALMSIFMEPGDGHGSHIYEAHKAVNNAIKEGKLLPASAYKCCACDETAREHHHFSYHPDNYLCVTPLCSKHHRLADRGKLNIPLGVVPTAVGLVRIAIATQPTPA